MRQRRGGIRSRSTVLAMLAAAALAGLQAQPSRRADADDLRGAYDTYRSMRQSSSHAALKWQYLGPTNVSGRAVDVAVADRGGSRRIYAAYATSGVGLPPSSTFIGMRPLADTPNPARLLDQPGALKIV